MCYLRQFTGRFRMLLCPVEAYRAKMDSGSPYEFGLERMLNALALSGFVGILRFAQDGNSEEDAVENEENSRFLHSASLRSK